MSDRGLLLRRTDPVPAQLLGPEQGHVRLSHQPFQISFSIIVRGNAYTDSDRAFLLSESYHGFFHGPTQPVGNLQCRIKPGFRQ